MGRRVRIPPLISKQAQYPAGDSHLRPIAILHIIAFNKNVPIDSPDNEWASFVPPPSRLHPIRRCPTISMTRTGFNYCIVRPRVLSNGLLLQLWKRTAMILCLCCRWVGARIAGDSTSTRFRSTPLSNGETAPAPPRRSNT